MRERARELAVATARTPGVPAKTRWSPHVPAGSWIGCLRLGALAALGTYCVWWVIWLSRGKLPPALFFAMTGLPAPTTGLTRSFASLLQGQWRQSILLHPVLIPIISLYAFSLGWVCWRFLCRRSIMLPRGFGYAWFIVLLAAWIVKLALGPRYW